MLTVERTNISSRDVAEVNDLLRAAVVMTPVILRLFPDTKSVVHVGAGAEIWASAFRRYGVAEAYGMDSTAGSDTVPPLVSAEPDARKRPIEVPQRFDLCATLNAAVRSRPQQPSAFVTDLCALSDAIVFNEAIPGQEEGSGDTVWLSSWAQLFSERGYECRDVLRQHFWHDSRVEWWYTQSLILFVRRTRQDILRHIDACPAPLCLDYVHPSYIGTRPGNLPVLEQRRPRPHLASTEGAEPGQRPLATSVDDLARHLEAIRRQNLEIQDQILKVYASTPWKIAMWAISFFNRHPLLHKIFGKLRT